MKKQRVIKWWFPLLAAVLLAIAALMSRPEAAETQAAAPPVLVIDPGHGGADGGAVASDGTTESGINLDIALRLEALCRFWGVDCVMTRQGEDISYPDADASIAAKKKADQYARVGLVNSTPGAVLLSIHQNKYPSPSPHGIQVFYGSAEGSRELAETLQANMTAQLSPENRRVASPADKGVFLMQKAGCTAVLAECGFLSNPDELSALKTEKYRTELAAVMLASYLQYIRGTVT